MASVTFLHLHDPEDDLVQEKHHHHHYKQTLTLDSLPYWSYDFHFLSSPDANLSHPDDDASLPNSVIVSSSNAPNNNSNSDNENGNNTSNNDVAELVSDVLSESDFSVIEGNHELDLGLALGFDSMDTNSSDVEIDICGSEYETTISLWKGGSDSEDGDENENDNRMLTIDFNSRDDYGIDDHVNDYYNVGADDDMSVSIPLFWYSLQLEDLWETIEDFEWEEVDGFTPLNVQTQLDTYPRRVPITIRPQQYQAGTSALVNYPTSSGSNPEDNLTNPVVLDLDDMAEMDRVKVEFPKLLEDRCKWLEEKF
ncbi:probable serine/threonine-protein kinase DDB_G0278509 [Gossypium hirsutum]|uniref:Probable serine/threonine-protein kinase DDB_G0278509 n=1 Tax=Gossypium hirsutum TaxID=3635 RepID=A0ABM3A623_GOSHI|nr:probable serine/threonine-protein kinase DDB_G0278509 [Gossypium hirsutum]